MSNSNSNPLCCLAATPALHKASVLPELSSSERLIVVPSFSEGPRRLCTALQSTLGKLWRSSPAKYNQSAIWQLPWGKAAKAKQGPRAQCKSRRRESVKGASPEDTSSAGFQNKYHQYSAVKKHVPEGRFVWPVRFLNSCPPSAHLPLTQCAATRQRSQVNHHKANL